MNHPAVNFVIFQLGWFSCVLGAAHGYPLLGVLVTAIAVAVHLAGADRPGPELKLIGFALVAGLILDSLLVTFHWLSYAQGMWLPGVAPYWIIAMWALFATTLNRSMSWLHGRYTLAALFGAIGGPLSYWAGARLGAVEVVAPLAAYSALCIIWATAMPVLMWFARTHDGVSQPEHLAPRFPGELR